MSFTITPEVNSSQEFIEIAQDFSNPLDLVREAISNGFDAHAKNMRLEFSVIMEYGERLLKIEIEDDGDGMDEIGLKSFFDLGNSLRRETKSETGAIGEKGHGTKVYFNSRKIEIITAKNGIKYHAVMDEPKKNLFNRVLPVVEVEQEENMENIKGSRIIIYGYNENRRDKFTHAQLKDYILWFTKFGSVEKCFGIEQNSNVNLKLKGVDSDEYEDVTFGHVFPDESSNVEKLFEKYLVDAPKWYCKKTVVTKSLKHFPEIKFQAVFYVEGTKVKYEYNEMIRRPGYSAPEGSYTVQDRYGVWLCKDYMAIQRKNDWVTSKGSEFTKLHAFVNCQSLRLTANRGSVENTPSEILNDLEEAVREIYESIVQSDDWSNLEWLESEVDAYNTVSREKSEFSKRIDKVNRTRTAEYKVSDDKTITLIEPQQENGVFTIFMQLSTYEPDIFPFSIVDYDTHFGIDVIVKSKDNMPIKSSKLYYVEFKNYLSKHFNHSFENLHSIVCWDINTTELKSGQEVTDLANQKRTLKIIPPENAGDYTRYYLDSLRSDRKIEVFVLKYYLEEKFGITFCPRNEHSIV